MIIYSESGEVIEMPDLGNGWVEVKTSDKVKEHHPEILLEFHIEEQDGKKIRMIDQQPKAAWDEYEEYGVYHPHEEMSGNQPTQEERIAALEQAMTAIEEGIASV